MPQPALKRDLSARELFSLAFGAIVGVSWIVLVGQWIGGAGSIGAMIAFVIGCILMLPIGQCYAVLGQRLPATGGEFVYAYRFFGPAAAFAVAWILALFYIAVCAFEAVSAAWVVAAIWPAAKGPLLYAVAGTPLHAGDLALGALFAVALSRLQLGGAQVAAKAQDIMVFLLVGLAIVFILGALWSGQVATMRPFVGGTREQFIALLLTTPLFYAGFGSVPQALGESSEAARRRVPIVIFVVLVASMLFKVGVILATALVLSPAEALGAEFPVALAFERAFGSPIVAKVALFTGVLGLLTTWNSTFYSASRVLYALGNGGLGPRWLGNTEPRRGVPRRAILLVTALTLCAVPFGKTVLVPIISLGGLAVTMMFALVAACLLKLRRAQGSGGLLLPVSGCLIAGALLLLNVVQLGGNVRTGHYVEVAVLLVWTVLGMAMWTLSRSNRADMDPRDRERRIMGSAATAA